MSPRSFMCDPGLMLFSGFKHPINFRKGGSAGSLPLPAEKQHAQHPNLKIFGGFVVPDIHAVWAVAVTFSLIFGVWAA